MNFLAHAYLSRNCPPALTMGNMMGDSIKGKAYENYEPLVQQGILLHRFIDFTADASAGTASAKKILRPHFGLYSGIIWDIICDYFLSNDTSRMPSQSRKDFAGNVYAIMEAHHHLMPPKLAHVYTYMLQQDWLYNYHDIQFIEDVLFNMNKRMKSNWSAPLAISLLNQHSNDFVNAYQIQIVELEEKVPMFLSK